MYEVSKILENKNSKEKILVKFEGVEKNNIDLVKVNSLLENYLEEKIKDYSDIPYIVSTIKTILKDFEEKNLCVSSVIKFENTEKFYVVYYIDNQLNKYAVYQKPDFFNKALFDYQKNKILKFSVDLETSTNYQQFFNYNSDILEKLKNVKVKELDDEDKIICQVYKIFYNSYPDFMDIETWDKIQSMAVILNNFFITLNRSYFFKLENNKVISSYLKQQINNLVPFGLIEEIDEPITLNEEDVNKIKIIGEEIKKATDFEVDKLNTLSHLIHISHYKLDKIKTKDDLKIDNKFTDKEILSNVELMKKVKTKIKK